jgi:hypothetical protein
MLFVRVLFMLSGTHFPRFRHFQFFLFFVFQRVNTPDALKQRFRWRSVLHETAPAILRRTQDRLPSPMPVFFTPTRQNSSPMSAFHPGKTDPLTDVGISPSARQTPSRCRHFTPGKTGPLTDARISPPAGVALFVRKGFFYFQLIFFHYFCHSKKYELWIQSLS